MSEGMGTDNSAHLTEASTVQTQQRFQLELMPHVHHHLGRALRNTSLSQQQKVVDLCFLW